MNYRALEEKIDPATVEAWTQPYNLLLDEQNRIKQLNYLHSLFRMEI